MRSSIASVALAVAVAVGVPGCGLLEAEADSKHLCIQQTNLARVPAAPPVSVSTPALTLRLDLGAALPDLEKSGTTLHLHPEAITLGSAEGNANFAGVVTATLTVVPPPGRSDLQPVRFLYQRPTPAPASVGEVPAVPSTPVDLADYLEGDSLVVQVAFTGTAPPQAWIAALEMCGGMIVRVNYWQRLTS